MKSKIVILNGRGGVGKDTFVNLCKTYCNCVHISSVDTVKFIARYVGWSGSKSEKDRRFLSNLKQLLVEYNDTPFTYTKSQIQKFYEDYPENALLFIDIREPSEIDKVRSYTDCVSCLIMNPRVPLIQSNPSDEYAENYNYDFCIYNDSSLAELSNRAKWFISTIIN